MMVKVFMIMSDGGNENEYELIHINLCRYAGIIK